MLTGVDHESLELIQETAVKAARIDVSNSVKLIPAPDVRQVLLIDKDGNHELLDKSPPPRNHKLLSCQEVVIYSRLMKSETPIVWIGREAIIVTHDAQRILGHSAKYNFQRTHEFKITQEALGKEPMSQKEFLTLLRVRLARSFSSEETRQALIKSVRSIRTILDQKTGQGTGSFEAGLQSSSSERIDWPETFNLSVCVFDDPAILVPQTIECVLDVDPSNASKPFTVTPISGDITKAINATLALAGEVIRAELTKDSIPVFLGEPTCS